MKSDRYFVWQEISIHAPREGSDIAFPPCTYLTNDFNPRSP